MRFKLYHFAGSRLALLIFFLLMSLAQRAYAMGIPGFPALNTLMGQVWAWAIGFTEFILGVGLIIQWIRVTHGHPDEKMRLVWIFVAMIFAPLTPSLVDFFSGSARNAGGETASQSWNGSNPSQ